MYRNPEVGQSSNCLWECCADQINRSSGSKFTWQEVKERSVEWLRQNEHYQMGRDCSLPVNKELLDTGEDQGTRCSLGQYVQAAFSKSWKEYVDHAANPETWVDCLCLFAVAEVFDCSIFVATKVFPFPDFFCQFGKGKVAVVLAHWKRYQFRSIISRHDWNILYESVKRERGLNNMDHRLYSGLLRYQDRTEDAVVHCKLEIEQHPNSLVGHHTWSIVMSDCFNSEEAMQHYLLQLQVCPDHPHSYNGVGTTLHDLRRYEDAIFFYKTQLYFNPMNKYSHLNMGLAYARLRRFEEADKEHRIQLMLYPTDRNTCDYYTELLNETKRIDVGIKLFSDLVAKEPWRNEWRIHLSRVYVVDKKYELAARELQIVLRNNPNDCRGLIALAELFERNGYYMRCATLLRKVLKIFPRHPRVRSFLGDAELKMGHDGVAEELLKEQLEMIPIDSEGYSRMAELQAQRGQVEDAIALYKKARSVDPTDSSPLFNIGLCYLDLHKFPEARAYFQRHLDENPDDAVSLLEVANTYYAEGDLQMTIRGYLQVLKIRPEHQDCRAWLAATYAEAGRFEEAIHEYEELVRISGKISFHYNIGFLYLTMADHTEDEAERQKFRRLSHLHLQLETGVRREFIEAPKATPKQLEEFQYQITHMIYGSRLTVRSSLMIREDPLPYGLVWTPEVHSLCSRLARKQVFSLLLICQRMEKQIGYPFPKDVKYIIIREILAPVTEGFIRSVLPPPHANTFLDAHETVAFRPVPPGIVNEPDLKAALAPLKVSHVVILYWPTDGAGPAFPSQSIPPGANPALYIPTLYVTFENLHESTKWETHPLLRDCRSARCSPAELLHVPFESCTLTQSEAAPFEGAISAYAHGFRNRQQAQVALALEGNDDCHVALDVAVCYHLGDEAGVKSAIHTLMMKARSGDMLAALNAVMVSHMLFVRTAGDSEWAFHFKNNTDYALTLMYAASLAVRERPCGEVINRIAMVLYDAAQSLSNDLEERRRVLESCRQCLELLVQVSPKHPTAYYKLGLVLTLQGVAAAERLKVWEACCARNPRLGHMEACAVLMEMNRVEDAFKHLEMQVAVDPTGAYGAYAALLFHWARRNRDLKDKALRKTIDDIKRFFDVNELLTGGFVRPALNPPLVAGLLGETDELVTIYDAFLEWERGLNLNAGPHGPQRVDFVARVAETPFGVTEDFEKEFL